MSKEVVAKIDADVRSRFTGRVEKNQVSKLQVLKRNYLALGKL